MTLQELRKRPHWSFSSLNSLLNICSLQWRFQDRYATGFTRERYGTAPNPAILALIDPSYVPPGPICLALITPYNECPLSVQKEIETAVTLIRPRADISIVIRCDHRLAGRRGYGHCRSRALKGWRRRGRDRCRRWSLKSRLLRQLCIRIRCGYHRLARSCGGHSRPSPTRARQYCESYQQRSNDTPSQHNL